jgi:hypothetical protein
MLQGQPLTQYSRLMREQSFLQSEAAGKSAQLPSGSNHTVAGDKKRDAILPIRTAHWSGSLGNSDLFRNLPIATRFPKGDSSQLLPHTDLKRASLPAKWEIKLEAISRKIFRHLQLCQMQKF